MSTLVCVPIMVTDEADALRDAALAREAGADMVEFRVDDFFAGTGDASDAARIARLVSASPLPCILTCRPTWEGGHYDADDDVRVAMFERACVGLQAGEHAPRYVDVELAAYNRSDNLRLKINLCVDAEREQSAGLILSSHDFDSRPADLTRRMLSMRSHGAARVHKVAFRARSLRDNIELFELVRQGDRPTIALGMGEFGLMSRVLAPKFGAFLTFASLRDASATAPGQPTLAQLLETYRFRSIRTTTKVFGVVGWPVSHSLSPRIHNAGFGELGVDAVYLPMPIAPGATPGDNDASLKATLTELIEYGPLDFRGCSVTIPHKESLVRVARGTGWEIDSGAAMIGAANTLVVSREDGRARVRVFNSDAPAAIESIKGVLGSRELAGLVIGVVGAGGAGRAIAFEAARAGAIPIVFNRDLARAEDLAGSVRSATGVAARGLAWDSMEGAACDVWVNCTPVGMKNGLAPGAMAIPEAALNRATASRAIVMDTVYAPRVTPLVKRARELGCTVVEGLEMFVRQAALQFEAWTGLSAPTETFRRVVTEYDA
ncbi:MAG: type I 3-dehydroquinate dehydratase [Phycisphaerae bacterium]|nr:type I 3-dehydroquinate dehydratase [Phycisphaerae bacterium]